MMQFRRKNIVPPGGQYFYSPEWGGSILAPTLGVLLSRIRTSADEHNAKVPDNIEALVMDFMCARLPGDFCVGDGEKVPMYTARSVRNAAIERARSNGRVTPALADERADICMRCPKNDMSICPTCNHLTSLARTQAGRQFREYTWLGVCACDFRPLGVEVCLDAAPVLEGDEVPDNCWRKH